ncbi:cell division protein ZapD [Psychrosphaera sp. B3R10]|uniref:Cell division protein ZapD n=1 Tax=Psychrosphaera algicola TaxID=3023714 RepID=A0ABT5FDC0_9GAMM|nr:MULTISPECIES: cell division protein ZapD [unclassified Psychrosphaera]MBU2882506.1 cell division protein ZapD [Psychrosphaera sp. I2R16]MBU2989476.1 cell division protein ZapD [Psychrosphaera sp. B3R10]MDC2889376.1 cell division protein ZapD [Psychrosphaera sp. G1-22]MDO6718310.1 cell division protein ZapD [Psychrosphaera sp. 1_MG-2023]
MNFVVFEHPLNEKVRVLLRLELLFQQLDSFQSTNNYPNLLSFFRNIFDCIELLERNDVRSTLTHYLDLLEKSMVKWAAHPEVQNESLQEKLAEAIRLQNDVVNMTKACQQLKEDKFLASLRQRFSIAGGACDFELPQLHYWRLQTKQERDNNVQEWLNILLPLKQALDFSLMFIRESYSFEQKSAVNGFYQDSSGDNVSLLRIRYDLSLGVFPTVSGSHRRFSISFMQPDKSSVKTAVNDTIHFELAKC